MGGVRKKKESLQSFNASKNMYNVEVTNVRTIGDNNTRFLSTLGLHQ